MERIYDEFLNEEIYVESYPSGLKAFCIVKKNFSKTFAAVVSHYGSVDSRFIHPETKKLIEVPDGIAHFLEHKLFEEEHGNVFDRFAKYGAMANAWTSFKSTVYYFISTNNFEENFDILLDFVQNLYLTQENVEKEKGIIEQEIRMYQDNPNWRVYFNLLNALYVKHTVKIDIAGSIESIRNITKEDLELCYKTFYHPSNMFVVVCGDVDPKWVFKEIEKQMKNKTYQSIIERVYPDEPIYIANKKIEQKLSVSTPLFYIGFKDVENDFSSFDLMYKDVTSQILMEILFGKSSKIYQEMYENGYINQDFGYDYVCEDDYSFALIGGESKDPEIVYDKILEHCKKVGDEGISHDVFERAKKVVIGNILRKFDNIEKISVGFINSYVKGVNMFEYPKVAYDVKIEDVQNRLKRLFNEQLSAISIIYPF